MRAHLAASLAAALAASTFVPASRAAVTLTGQSRSLHAESTGTAWLWAEGANPTPPPTLSLQDTDADDAGASGFGVFQDTVASAAPDVLIFPLTGMGTASQDSSLSTAAISASAGTDTATDSYWLTAPQLATVNALLAPPTYYLGFERDASEGESLFSVSFDVSVPTPYTLQGNLAVSAVVLDFTLVGTSFSQATGSIALRHAQGGTVAEVTIDQYEFCEEIPPGSGEVLCTPGSRPLSAQGVLSPGSYVLEASTASSSAALCAILATPICVDVSNSSDFTLEMAFGALPAPLPGLAPPALGALALGLAATGLWALRRVAP
jgi:hypothetical protein